MPPPKGKLERGSDLPGAVDGPLGSREAVWFSREAGLELLGKQQATLRKAGGEKASVVGGTRCAVGAWAQERAQGLPRSRLPGQGRGEGLHTVGCSGRPLMTGTLHEGMPGLLYSTSRGPRTSYLLLKL